MSIPAPVYCSSLSQPLPPQRVLTICPEIDADIVCSRAKNHYDPEDTRGFQLSESGDTEGTQGSSVLQRYKDGFKPLNATTARNMYCGFLLLPFLKDWMLTSWFSLVNENWGLLRLPLVWLIMQPVVKDIQLHSRVVSHNETLRP